MLEKMSFRFPMLTAGLQIDSWDSKIAAKMNLCRIISIYASIKLGNLSRKLQIDAFLNINDYLLSLKVQIEIAISNLLTIRYRV